MKHSPFIFTFIAILMGLSANSCSNDDDTLYDGNKESKINTKSMGESYQVLGYGYDITGEYLVNSSIKNSVLDIEKIINEKPNRFRKEFVGETNNQIYLGEDYYSYLKEIYTKNNFKGSVAESPKEAKFDYNNKENIPYLFSATFNSELTNKYNISNQYSFARVDMMIKQRQYLLNVIPEDVKNYLTESFETDLNRLSSDDIVSKYGTHVLLDFVVGGSCSAFYKSVITENSDQISKQKILYGGIAGALQKVGLNFILNLSEYEIKDLMHKNNQWKCAIVVRGGSNHGDTITINSNSKPSEFLNLDNGSWSINDQSCVLAEINFNKTYPIYDFISDPIKKEQIKKAVIKYLDSKEKKALKTKPMYELKSRKTGDTWWVYSKEDAEYAVQRWREEYHGVVGFVLADKQPNTKPLYRLKSRKAGDTWYVFKEEDVEYARKKWGDISSGIDGYVYENEPTEVATVPMYRLKSRKTGDTWYAYSWKDYSYAMNKWRDVGSGIDGYLIK